MLWWGPRSGQQQAAINVAKQASKTKQLETHKAWLPQKTVKREGVRRWSKFDAAANDCPRMRVLSCLFRIQACSEGRVQPIESFSS